MLKSTLVCAGVFFLSTHGYADESSDKAVALLKRAFTTIQSAKSISVAGIATADEVEPSEDFKVQKQFAIRVKFERPNKLFAQKIGDENQMAHFDGKSFTIIDPVAKKYGQADVEGTLDNLLMKLEELNVQAPLIDLLHSNISELAQKSVLKAKYIGRGQVGVRKCEHVALRTALADWQLWISDDAAGTICKSVITTRSLAQAPQYEVTFGTWKLNTEIDDKAFSPVIPEGAEKVALTPGAFRQNKSH